MANQARPSLRWLPSLSHAPPPPSRSARQVHGTALVTTQHITGEALALRRKAGDQVPAGAQVVEGVLVVRTTASMEQSTPARIARLTAAAQRSRPEVRPSVPDVQRCKSCES
jgi:cation transport ATPase